MAVNKHKAKYLVVLTRNSLWEMYEERGSVWPDF